MLQRYDERNKDLLININGSLIHRDEAGVSPFDSVVQGGDAVWEGLRVYNGKIYRLAAHLRRLRRSAQALAFDSIPSAEHIAREIARTLEANGMYDGVHIRLTLTRGMKVTSGMDPRLNTAGPTLIVLAEHKAPVYADAESGGGLSLITSTVRRHTPDTLDPNIHHNNLLQSILAKIQANVAGADDALMLDERGFVAETNATHVFIVADGEVVTSRPIACPEGITRESVIELCARDGVPCREADFSLTHVYAADECFTTGTMGELAWVGSVDGRTIGDGTRGPITAALAERFHAYAIETAEPVLPAR